MELGLESGLHLDFIARTGVMMIIPENSNTKPCPNLNFNEFNPMCTIYMEM